MFNNQEWLDNLKEGEKVAIRYGSGFKKYGVATIIKITPTRVIRTNDGLSFNKDGYERGDLWSRSYLTPITDEILEKIEYAKLINVLNNTKFGELPLETLRNIYELLKNQTP